MFTATHTRTDRGVCAGWILHPDGVTLQSGLMLLHQILNNIPASLAFVTWLFPAPEEPLGKFKAAAPSSVRSPPLPYDLSAFKAAGAHQFRLLRDLRLERE